MGFLFHGVFLSKIHDRIVGKFDPSFQHYICLGVLIEKGCTLDLDSLTLGSLPLADFKLKVERECEKICRNMEGK
jgi:hypothetical protein